MFGLIVTVLLAGTGSLVRCASTWHADGCGFDPPLWQHSSVEIGHEIISTAILSLPLIQVGQLSVTGERMCTYYWLTCLGSLPRNSVVRLTDSLDMTIVVDWDVKP